MIRTGFRNNYIRRVIKLVFSSCTPWVNPSIEVLQQEFNAAYPSYRVRLHLDDAAVVPVRVLLPTFCSVSPLTQCRYRQSGTLVFCVAKLGRKLSERSPNTSPVSTISGCSTQSPPERHTFRRSSQINNIHLFGSTFVQATYPLVAPNYITMM